MTVIEFLSGWWMWIVAPLVGLGLGVLACWLDWKANNGYRFDLRSKP